jgi:ABC-2 type transport system permease protein
MSLRRAVAITKRLLRQFRRDHRTLALVLVVPLVLLGLVGYLLRGGGSNPEVGVVNLDTGALGATIAAHLHQDGAIAATDLDLESAKRRLSDRSLVAYVVIPADLAANATLSHRIAPEVHLEGSEPGPAATVLTAVQRAVSETAAALGSRQGVQLPRVASRVTWLHGGPSLDTLDYFGSAFIGFVVFFLVFVVTSVSFLRERAQGTLERLMASPLRRGEVVVGYMLGFGLLALAQGAIILLFSLFVLHIHNEGNAALVFLVEALMAIAAVNLGIFLSLFARSEFQAVQFIPLVILPQALLSGILFPVSQEPRVLQYASSVLPLTYAVNAMRDITIRGAGLATGSLQLDLAVIGLFAVALVPLAAMTLRREVA